MFPVPLLADTYWPETEHIIRIVAAVVLGGLIGLERELRDKPAGFRTILLICVGACVFTMISALAGGPDSQHTRIAAQIVTGIGFLGAGAILRDRASIVGLTTAATIWSAAAVGMAAGFGQIGLAALGAVVILVVLFLFDFVEDWIGDLRDTQEYRIVAENKDDTLDRVRAMITEAGLSARKHTSFEEGDSVVLYVVVMGSKSNHDRFRQKLIRSKDYTLREARLG